MEDETDRHQRHFSFPTLSPDGSVEELPARTPTVTSPPRYYTTPPAALSSLGARLKMADLSASTASLADSQYDMMEDLSEMSNDDQETASLLSDDGRDESDDDEASILEGSHDEAPTVEPVVDALTRAGYQSEDVEALDSFLTDDLETPRQSIIPASRQQLDSSLHKHQQIDSSVNNRQKRVNKVNQSTNMTPTILRLVTLFAVFPIIWTVLSGLTFFQPNPVAQTALRREALTAALEHATNFTLDVTRTYNVDHLLPMPTATSVDFIGQRLYTKEDRARYQTVLPNRIIVSLPRQSGYTSVDVVRGDKRVPFTATKLIDGVYDVSILSDEAYGHVNVNITTAYPPTSHTITAYFGMMPINKDLIVARDAAKSLGDRVHTELVAVGAATRKITTEIAIGWTRDLQVIADSAVSIYRKSHKTLGKAREHALGLKKAMHVKGKKMGKKARKGQA